MVSVTKHSTPALRFDGFDGEWEVKEFGSVVTRSSAASAEPGLPRLEYEDIVSGVGVLNKDLNRKESLKAGLLFGPGDVLYGKLRPYLKNWLLPDFSGIAVGDFWVLQSLTADPKFLYQLIQTPTYDATASISSGSKMPRADWKLVSQSPMAFPSTREEQSAIGELFADLDALIEQHRAKHANLQQTKTALLQRMFPQDGADEPELRLDGFSGHWKRVSFGDTVESFKYGVNAAATDFDGVTKYLRITDLDESSGQFGTGLVTSPRAEEETIRDFLLEEGDMVFARTGATVGRSYLFRKSVGRTVWAGFLIRARFKRNTDPQFVAAYAQTDSYWTYVKLTSQRSGQPGLNSAEYAAMPITTPPTLEEQRAIGEVFADLDALIAAEHRYITQLTQTKTALLQRMFV